MENGFCNGPLGKGENMDIPWVEAGEEVDVGEECGLLVLGGFVGKARHGCVEKLPACST